MTEMNVPIVTPAIGADFAPGVELPAPAQEPEKVITVPNPERENEQHKVQIYSSRDPKMGMAARVFAQKLHTEVYLENNYIDRGDLNGLEIFEDAYSDRSTYLYAKNGSKVAAARYIHADKRDGILSLPTAQHFEIETDIVREVAGVRKLADLKPKEVVEISGLVSRKQHGGQEQSIDATIALYGTMLRDSLEQGHKLWMLNVDKGFLRILNGLAGRQNVRVLGPEKQYMGPATVPVAINPQEVVRTILQGTGPISEMKRTYFREVMGGVDDRKIPKDIRRMLAENGFQVKEKTTGQKVKEIVTNPKALAYAGIMAYSTARALPASDVEQFGGSVAALWGIDVATAVPYTWGVLETFSGKSAVRRSVGAVVGAASFAAPYAYFEAAGESYPPFVNGIIGAFVGTAVLKEAITQTLRSRRERAIEAGLSKTDIPAAHPILVKPPKVPKANPSPARYLA